jgi:hypothetical protein
VTFGSSEQTQLVTHVAERYGFVRVVDPARSHSIADRLHLVGESILISLIVISHNPAAFRTDCFRHNRIPVYLPRAELMRRFGAREEIAGQSRGSTPSQPIFRPTSSGITGCDWRPNG